MRWKIWSNLQVVAAEVESWCQRRNMSALTLEDEVESRCFAQELKDFCPNCSFWLSAKKFDGKFVWLLSQNRTTAISEKLIPNTSSVSQHECLLVRGTLAAKNKYDPNISLANCNSSQRFACKVVAFT